MSDRVCPEPPAPPHGPDVGPIRPILQGYLDAFRTTLLRQCAGLTGEQLVRRATPPSTLSLLGLVRHLTMVERVWLRIRIAGEDVPPLYPGHDEAFDGLDPGTAPQAIAALSAEIAACDAAVADLSMDAECAVRGDVVSLASVYVHLVEEYARHCGHADLLREAIDGVREL
jgi:hypothetical protein